MEVALRQGFNRLEQLIAQSEALRLEYDAAQDALYAVQINFNLGRVIHHDVEQAIFTAFRVEQNIEILLYQKWALKFMLENPSLLV